MYIIINIIIYISWWMVEWKYAPQDCTTASRFVGYPAGIGVCVPMALGIFCVYWRPEKARYQRFKEPAGSRLRALFIDHPKLELRESWECIHPRMFYNGQSTRIPYNGNYNPLSPIYVHLIIHHCSQAVFYTYNKPHGVHQSRIAMIIPDCRHLIQIIVYQNHQLLNPLRLQCQHHPSSLVTS